MDNQRLNEGESTLFPETPQQSSARLYDYLVVVWRHKRFFVIFTIVGLLLAIAYSLTIPYTYVATATLMPPERESGSRSNFTSLIQSGGIDLFGLGETSSGRIFIEMLQSRTLADSLIERLDLMERLGLPESRIVAIDELKGKIEVEETKSGVIMIGFSIGTPRFPSDEDITKAKTLSAEIVNEAIEVLDILNREKMVTQAKSSREFLGRMVELKQAELDSARLRMATFQKENRAFAVDKQLELVVKSLAETQYRIQTLELEIASVEQEFRPDAQVLANMRGELAELRQQQAAMSTRDVLGMNLDNAPDIAMEYLKRRLDLEVATQVYSYLVSQYNSEQVQEARDLPTISVLDPAVPPEYRSAPRRTFLVMISFFIIVIIGVVLIFLLEWFGKDVRRFSSDYFPRWVKRILRLPSTSGG
ncbi:MAG: hypothetical protein J4G05_00540 [Chlorobi bacterium]|nr:hypothetical protein [Chlorobiota bacterium]